MTLAARLVAMSAGALLAGLVSAGASAEDGFKPGSSNEKIPCPHPSEITLIVRKPSVAAQDFPGAPPPALAGLNDTSSNKPFRHTFTWTEPEGFCCEIISARLKVGLVANSEAGNDSIGIYSQGSNVAGMGGYIFHTPPVDLPGTPQPASAPAGTTKTIVWPMNAAALADMNMYHRLSFGVQDDTRVTSADLTILACCVTHSK